ncbi:S8 family serine peptidase [Desulfovibrio aerotolerans]|uniref:S8 family serine peptidase n=1 Tax=Solidesulfovibrio aerotolerans TaxID=295255 RepID=A0A7C9IV19_9BACT|nr:S8 family serine peptidase [Solidesulfovibrio aerotolerans]MYL84300.1 S8 family serine peptidase [Solidesulfovibrio aerotolerans]
MARTQALEADAALTAGITAAGDTILGALDTAQASVQRRFQFVPAMAMRVSPQGLARLQSLPNVVSIEPDAPAPVPEPVVTAPEAGSALPDSPSVFAELIGASVPWGAGYTGSGWYVAILDTGIRPTHTFFSGKTIVEACFSAQANCPNSQTTMYGAGAAAHYPSSYSGWDHGTHVSGIAAGRDMTTYCGVAKQASILAINVFSKINDGTLWVGTYSSDQIAGLEYIYSLRNTYSIGAVNMSLGGGAYNAYCDSAAIKASIDNLAAVNIAVAIASGNNYYTRYISGPACVSTAVSVGASSSSDVEGSFSNYHPALLDLFAPGVAVTSSTADSDFSFEAWNGTSMATPHVAGAWTLLRQRYPTRSVPQILGAVQAAGQAVTLKAGDLAGGSVRRIALNTLFATQVNPVAAVNSLLLN